MRRSFNRMLSVLMALAVLVGVVPFSAFAEVTPTVGEVRNGYYDESGNWIQGGSGSVVYDINGTAVTLSKTARHLQGDTYEVTLRVETSTTTVTNTNSAAVVLVIDTSSSMKSCAQCGGRDSHERSCGLYDRSNNSVTTGQNRLTAAASAAAEFIASYAGSDPSAKRMLSIVTFDGSAATPFGWGNVAGGADNNSYNSALSAIYGLNYHTGTYMQGGLRTAAGLLGSDEVSEIGIKHVVLLSDGAPTLYDGDMWNTWPSQADSDAAVAQANNVKATGSDLYTVCFGASDDEAYPGGPSVGSFLAGSIATSPAYAYNAGNASELLNAFRAISSSITSGLSGAGWTATDPMPGYVRVTGGTGENFYGYGNESTWELGNPVTSTHGNVTTYTYTNSYIIEFDIQNPGLIEGEFYPANEPTYLNVDGEQYAFPVPGVTGFWPRTDVTVEKIWEDGDDRDRLRTDSVTLQLSDTYMKNGVMVTEKVGAPVTVSAETGWKHTFENVIEKSEGVVHKYTIEELNVPAGYVPAYSEDGLSVTNIHEIESVDVKVMKIWNDGGNRDGIRPESITVMLLANGNVISEMALTAGMGWTGEFTGLPKNENGREIVYSVEEVPVAGYWAAVDGYVITNTHEVEKTEVSVTKLWADEGDRDGIRPDSIDLTLYANGEAVQTVAVSGTGDTWTHTFTGLNKYDAGELITYTVSEAPVAGYETTYSEDTLTVTNTHNPETVNVSGTKTWNDDGNRDGKRPEAITVNLLKNGNIIDTITVTEAQGWSWSFEALPRFENGGNEIVYSVTENAVEGYTASYSGYDITNSYTPEELGITVVKSWVDGNDRDGIRPDSVTVVLIANGRETDKTLELSAENNWTASFTGLAKYSSGVPVEYSVKEISVAGYGTVISGNVTEGFTVTNTHEPETFILSGTKFWNDDNDRDGIRPERITVKILADGVEVAQLETSRVNDWNYSLELPRYRDGGVEIVYTVAEEPVEGYTAEYDGYDVTNTHEPARTELGVTKTWVDGNDNDGIRPDSVTVELYADGVATGKTLTLSEENGWAGKFEQLVKFSSGKEIVYSAVETDVPEGYAVTYDEADGSVNVINTHESETVSVSVTKVWSDGDNAAELRPESVTVNLIADGTATGKSLVLSGENGWTGEFEQLAKFASGKEIIYTVTEDAVENYTAEITGDAETGFTVTNCVVDVPPPQDDDPVDPPAEDPDVPYTGAKTMLGLWSALALASLAGLGASVMLLRKKREN